MATRAWVVCPLQCLFLQQQLLSQVNNNNNISFKWEGDWFLSERDSFKRGYFSNTYTGGAEEDVLFCFVFFSGRSLTGSPLYDHHCWIYVIQTNHHKNTDSTREYCIWVFHAVRNSLTLLWLVASRDHLTAIARTAECPSLAPVVHPFKQPFDNVHGVKKYSAPINEKADETQSSTHDTAAPCLIYSLPKETWQSCYTVC